MGMKEIATAKGLVYGAKEFAHRRDPVTSKTSAHAIAKSGRIDGECAQILDALKRFPLHTARELARDSGIDYYVIQKRLSVLERNGYAQRRGARVCTASGTGLEATQWEAK